MISLQSQLAIERAARLELEWQLKQANAKIAQLEETVDKYSNFFT